MGGNMFRSSNWNWHRLNRVDAIFIAEAGFTLIEVIVVIVLIGALTLTAMPLFRHWSHQALAKSAAWDVANLLHQARSLAIGRNLEYHVICDYAQDSCQVEVGDKVRDSDNWSTVGPEIHLPAGTDLRGTVDCDVLSGTASIQFNPDGTCNQLYFCVSETSSGDVFKVGTPDKVTGRVVVTQ